MRLIIQIPHGDSFSCHPLLLDDIHRYQTIEVPGVVILDFYKHHGHRYVVCGFFYGKKVILRPRYYSTKKELHGAVQKFLQEYL